MKKGKIYCFFKLHYVEILFIIAIAVFVLTFLVAPVYFGPIDQGPNDHPNPPPDYYEISTPEIPPLDY